MLSLHPDMRHIFSIYLLLLLASCGSDEFPSDPDAFPTELPDELAEQVKEKEGSLNDMVESAKENRSTKPEVMAKNEEVKSGSYFEESDSMRVYRSYLYNAVHGKVFYFHKKKGFISCMGRYKRGKMVGDWKFYGAKNKVAYELVDVRKNKISQGRYAPKYMAQLVTYTFDPNDPYDPGSTSNEVTLLFNDENWQSDHARLKHGDEKIYDAKGSVVLLKRWDEGELVEMIKLRNDSLSE